ncbi:lipopolysaccharide biosynthesis protein [Tessaracoccus sp. ZS01]|uniref:lipopolysaccharide biosynthesis protein n=1 Tax=Tessaracoccus sp. ZS01 TaxID=1906324 RepID=UPI00096DC647|nr:oligosaccharide flippase family protein [Tessaracoccus sp. ZS01]OMG54148.1 hypothetical protein BJN44_10640 [Tessaracoccus sp. ZS01]
MGRKPGPALRAITLLASGTALGQLIAIGAMPLITRIYSPAEYGVLGLFSSVVVIAGSVAGLKYDAAVILPARNGDGNRIAIGLFVISILSVAISSAILLLFLIASQFFGGGLLVSMGHWALLLPVGTFAAGVSLSFTALATRAGEFSRLSHLPPLQKGASVVVQIGGGLLGVGVGGLLVGALLQSFVSIGLLARGRLKSVLLVALSFRGTGELRGVAHRYRDFPSVNAPTALLNSLAWNSQIFLLALFYTPDELGMFSLAMGMVGLPLNVILTAVSQVYLRESADRKSRPDRARFLWVRVLVGLLLLSVPIFVGLVLFCRYLVVPIFGSAWSLTEMIALALLPILWGRFVTTTLTTTFTVYRRQVWMLVWQVFAVLVTSAAYLLGGANGLRIDETVALASWATLPVYLAIIPLSLRAMSLGVVRS